MPIKMEEIMNTTIKSLAILTLLTLSFSALASNQQMESGEITRTINGADYFLSNDFDTADGECALRGFSYATSFYSYESKNTMVAKLNPDGATHDLITANGDVNYPIINGITCE